MSESIDILKKVYPNEKDSSIEVFGHGFVKLTDCSPRVVPKGRKCEFRAVQSARVSYGRVIGDTATSTNRKGETMQYADGLRSVSEDANLLRYLIRHGHTSPLESISFQFVLKVPIHVKNQIIRHRTARVNEYSQRYNKVDLGFYNGSVRMQGNTHNKQSSDGKTFVSSAAMLAWSEYVEHTHKTLELYNKVVESGIAREVARSHLPLSTFTIMYFNMDLNNILKFLRLRTGEGAQKEVRDVAEAMRKLIEPLVPVAMEVFDNEKEGMFLNKNDIDYLNCNGETASDYNGNSGEYRELKNKRRRLNKFN